MNPSEISMISNIHRLAFGEEEGAEIAALAESIFATEGTISVCAQRDGKLAGNVLFMPFFFHDHPEANCYLLAPLGVLPAYQRTGVGKNLMEEGLKQLKTLGADAVFVLGIPTFYPQYGFVPTDKETPYPDLLTLPESWMALELNRGSLAPLSGSTSTIEPLMKAHYWDTSGYG